MANQYSAEPTVTDKTKQSPVSSQATPSHNQNAQAKEQALSLIDWAKSILTHKNEPSESAKTHETTSVDLSRFGLQTPGDVIQFLKTPAGETVRTEIIEQIAHEKEAQEKLQADAIEHTIFMHRLLAFFLMLFISERTDAAAYIKELTIQYNEKIMTDEAKAIKESFSSTQTSDSRKKELTDILTHYDNAINQVKNKLQNNSTEQQSVQEMANKLDLQGLLLTSKYDQFNQSLMALEKSADMQNIVHIEHLQSQITELTDQVKGVTEEIEQLIKAEEHEKAAVLTAKNNALKGQLGGLHHMHTSHLNLIQNKIAELAEGMLSQIDEMNRLAAANEDKQLMEVIQKHNAINLQIAELHDMHAVYKGDKCIYNAQGKPVTSFKDAEFILPKEYKIVEENGTHYLLKPGQNWNNVKENPQQKNAAQQEYERTKQELIRVKNVVETNEGIEKKLHKERVNTNQKQLSTIHQQRLVLENQNKLLQSARASTQHLLDTGNFTREAPRPTPTMQSTPHAPKTSQSAATLFYRDQIQLLRKTSQVLPQDLLKILGTLPDTRIPGLAKLKADIENMSKIQPRTPIPHQMMQSILQNMERFGVDANKPSVTSITKPSESRRNTPTPFNMKPDPYKK